MPVEKIIALEEGADLDALSCALAVQKIYPDSKLLKPRYLSRRSSAVFKDFGHLFRITESLPEKFELIIVDSAHVPENLPSERITKVIRYDHHPDAEVRESEGKVEKVGSATTLAVEDLMERKVNLTEEEASVIALGIYEDTGNLTFEGTTERDARALAWLISQGANLKTIRKYIRESYTREQLEAVQEILSSIEKIYLEGREIAIATAVLKEYQPDVNSLLYEVKDLKEADAFFVIIEAERKTYVFGRSQSSLIDAGKILSVLGGGGHEEAGAVKLENVSAERIKEILKDVLKGEKLSSHRVKDIMTSPPYFLRAGEKISDALEELSARGIANAPVVDEEGRVIGIVSKKALLKVSKVFPDKEIRTFLNTEFHKLSPDSPIWEAEEIVTKYGQKLIPVIEGDRLVGVVTRFDVLQRLRKDLKRFKAQKKKLRLPSNITEIAREIGELSRLKGFRAYLVGGVVRDILLGKEIFDLDLVIEGNAIEVACELASKHGVECHTFQEFGTAHLKIGDLKIEFATTRRETYPHPGSYPLVEPSSIKEDLIRRDFTINAMAISINPEDFGTLIDFFGGLRDLKDRLIRVIHPVSFVEDPVRILRALRFAGRLDFNLSKNTASLLTEAVDLGLLKVAPRGRIISEVRLALKEERLLEILNLYKKYRVLEHIIEGFQWKEAMFEELLEFKKVADWHSLEFPQERIDYGWIYLMLILKSTKEPTAMEFLKESSAPSWVRENMPYLFMLKRIRSKIKKASRPSEVYRSLKNFHLSILLILMTSDEIRERVKLYLEKLRNFKLSVEEIEDLKSKGFEGKKLGEAIETLKCERMDRAFSYIMEKS